MNSNLSVWKSFQVAFDGFTYIGYDLLAGFALADGARKLDALG